MKPFVTYFVFLSIYVERLWGKDFKAIDKVWHCRLLFNLEQNGICGDLLKLLSNYLSNRKQRVVLNRFDSGGA